MMWRELAFCAVLTTACSVPVPPREAFPVDADDTAAAPDGDAQTTDAALDAADTALDGNDTVGGTDAADVGDAAPGTDIGGEDAGTDATDAADAIDAVDVLDAADAADAGDAPDTADAADAADAADVDLCASVTCPDLPCATQACDPVAGKCVATAKVNGWACDDGKKCTDNDVCTSGVCAGSTKSCDDGNMCTNDGCNASLGCTNTVVKAGTACDDGDACTVGDVCVATTCTGGAKLWSKTFGTDESFFNGVAAAADAGWVATGGWANAGAAAGQTDFWLVKINAVGGQDWAHTYGTGAGTGVGRAVLATADGYVAAGEKSLNSNETAAWLLKTDKSGVMQWQKTWGAANKASARAVVADGDGVIVVGRMPTVDLKAKPWVVRVNGTGQETWSVQPTLGSFSGEFSGASEAPQGFVAVGQTSNGGSEEATLARFDNSGNLLWHREYGSDGIYYASAVVASGGGWVVVGTRKATGPVVGQMCLFATDASGQLLWEHGYGTGMVNPGLALATLDDGYVAVGESDDFTNIPAAFVVRTDQYGAPLWSQIVANTSNVAGVLTGDGLVLAGQSRGPIVSPRYAWLSRTDLWGNATCSTSGACAGYTNDCDDGNPCTADLCAKGACSHTSLADASPCGSGDACKVGETCTAGNCGGGGAKLFEQSVTGVLSVTGAAALAVGNGGFTISATTNGASLGNARLVHTDAAGGVSWDHTYSLGSYAGQVAALIGTGDGYGLAGSVASDNNAEDAFLIVTDASGVAKVNVELGTPADEWIAALAQTSNGYLLAGKSGITPGAHELLLLRTDSLGAPVWQKTYGGAGKHAATAVAALTDGAIAGGWSQAPGGTAQVWLLRTDTAGTQLWSVLTGATVAAGHNVLAVLADGFAITGNTPGSGDLTLTRTDASGIVLWTHSYPGATTANAIAATGDGFMITGGSTNGFQLRTDSDGNMVWQHASPSPNDGVAVLSDGFAFSAAATGGLRLTRTDLWGNASCASSGTCASLSVPDCDDGNPCTADLCDAAHSGCWHANMADGLVCAYGATCGAGVCACTPGYIGITGGGGKVCAADGPVWGLTPFSPASLIDNGDGTVSDDFTGLTWQQADPGGQTYKWDQANQFCVGLKLGSHADWRLPTLAELNTLIDFNKSNPATANLLQTNVNLAYWSATLLANAPNNAWGVSFVIGTQQAGQLTSANHTRCVRGTTASHVGTRFTPTTGTVTDTWTGLLWERAPSPSGETTVSAKGYCDSLVLEGSTGWRIPTIVELRSIVDRSASGPAIDSSIFPGTPSEWFWASSGAGGSSNDYWSVYFSEGISEGNAKVNAFRVRCVK